ncbi:MAG: hypothetical protein ACQES8_06525 [Thermodesulfobacteriota bacterium]
MITQLNKLYFSDVTTKLDLALDLYRNYHSTLKADIAIQKELARLKPLIAGLEEQMAAMAIFDLCAKCGQKNGGGCCSAFMAGETDSILLLVNLLLDVDVSFQHDDGSECVYLGPNGCIFKAKPMFCLNYNCSTIYGINSQSDIVNLNKATGAVLGQQYTLEQKLLRSLIKR